VKLANETKVGVLGVIVITLLVLGFNFLKGKKIFSDTMTIYAKYSNIQGLTSSNPIIINGLQVGIVSDISTDKNMKEILVTISIQKDINIPSNSLASITPNPLTVTKMEIKLGDNNTYLKNGDTLLTSLSEGFMEGIINSKVDPILNSVNQSVHSIDSLLNNVNSLFDNNNKKNISSTLENLNDATASLQMILDKKGPLTNTLTNAEKFTGNLNANNKKIDSILISLNTTATHLSQLDLEKTLTSLQLTINSLKQTVEKLNSKEGSVGLLMNDPSLYKNLNATANKINVLLDDIRVHPKRYVSVSMFGKKEKEAPLQTPLPDTLDAPYINK